MPKKLTLKEFEKRVKEKYGNEYTILGEYITNHTPIKLKHNICGNIWDTTAPYDFLKPHSNTCPKCSHPSRIKTIDEFKNDVFNLVGDKYTVLGKEYYGNKIKIKMKHEVCGNIWDAKPNLFLNGCRCPECAKKYTESRGIKKIKKWLNSKNIIFEEEKKFDNLVYEAYLRFDIYLVEYNAIIEFDGEHHFKPKRGGIEEYNKTKIRDNIKNDYCINNNIPLLRIPYWDEKKIDEILNNWIEV